MYSYRLLIAFTLSIALSLSVCATASLAQIYTLTIQDGRVLINGKQVDEEDVPASLIQENLYLSMSFPGTSTATFELNGNFYELDGESLREIERNDFLDSETTVVFRNNPSAARTIVEADAYAPQRLNERAAFQQSPATPVNVEYGTLMQQYVAEVLQRDRALYNQLMYEIELERQTQEIALQARMLPEGSERDQLLVQLREVLGQAFALKQENRKQEIVQLEEQLLILQKRLDEREAMKDKVIENRVRELVGTVR